MNAAPLQIHQSSCQQGQIYSHIFTIWNPNPHLSWGLTYWIENEAQYIIASQRHERLDGRGYFSGAALVEMGDNQAVGLLIEKNKFLVLYKDRA